MSSRESVVIEQVENTAIRKEALGVLRVGRTRITLDLVVEQYENGMSVAEIVEAYDSLKPSDVEAAIDYYLENKPEVTEYLNQRRSEAAAIQREIEKQRPTLTRRDLLARRNQQGVAHASVGH